MSGFVGLLGIAGVIAGAALSAEASDDAGRGAGFLLMLASLFMIGWAASN